MKKECTSRLLFLFICFFALTGIYAQSRVFVRGIVTDANQEPLVGVTVRMQNNSNVGTITDIDGKFSLEVPNLNVTLTFTYIGYRPQNVTLQGQSQIALTMQEDAMQLEEVIVSGYGAGQRKATMTGSISQINSKELLKAPMQNVSNLLTGKIPGLTSIQSSGKPGDDGTALYVRGQNTFAGGNGPAVIVDGVPRLMDYVNPNDIETISVLKDAAASIYGINSGHGVILITTKKGGDGAAKISYDGSMTLTNNTAMPEFLNAKDYMYWNNKAREMDGLTPLWTADIQNKVLQNDPNSIWGETNWLDKAFRTGLTQQHNISASGGTERTKYYASLGFMNQEGTLVNTGLKRYNIRTNLDIQVAKNMKFLANISGYRSDRHWPASDILNQGEFSPIRQLNNTIPIIKDTFKGLPTAWNNGTYNVNGYAAATESGYKDQTRYVLDTDFKLEYDFSDLTSYMKGLKASIFGAFNYGHTIDSNYDRFYELYTVNANLDEAVLGASGYTQGGTYSKSSSWTSTWMIRPQVEYARSFGRNNVSALLFYEAKQWYDNTMTGTKRGYYSDDPVDISLGTESVDKPVTGSHQLTGEESYGGRFNYAYADKYLLELSFRYDGSYVFAPENRHAFFPAVSAGWVVSEEKFFDKWKSVVEYLKLRASYGEAGTLNDVPAFLYQSTFATSANSMVLGGAPVTQFYTNNAYIDRSLTWATISKYNFAIETSLWHGLLGAEVELFYQYTKDILEGKSGNYPPSLGGYYPSRGNTGRVDNRGIEITLKHRNVINSDWDYFLSGSFSFARNRVLSKAVTDTYPNYRAQLGEPMGARYGFIAEGLFQTAEEIAQYPAAPSGNIQLGDLKYRDINGDGIISSMYDYVKTGYGGVPEISFSMNMEVNYKDFYLTMLWQGVTHTDYELSGVYSSGVTSSTVYTSSFAERGNSPYYRILGAWTPEHTDADYPRLSTSSSANNAWQSTWWVVNGEYLRLKTMNIGYTVPAKLLKRTPFTRVNIYLAGTNLLTLSHFKYIDPESPSVSNGYYPQQKTYSLGLNVTF